MKVSKLEGELRNREKTHDMSIMNRSSVQFKQLCEQEAKELRTTIARLEKLLSLEREERSVSDKKTLQVRIE